MDEQSQKEIASWKRFIGSATWKMLVSDLKKRVYELEASINKVGGNEVKYSEKDIAILEKQAILRIVNIPQQVIKDLDSTVSVKMESLDAFDDYEEIEYNRDNSI